MFAFVALAVIAATPLSPTQTLKARDTEIRAVLPPSGQAPDARTKQKLEDTLLKAVDVEQMAKDALGKNWAVQTKKKRREFIDAFRARFKKATSQQLDLYRSARTDYQPEVRISDDQVKVPTELNIKGEPTAVGYVMKHEKDGWRIVDIVVDGVSTIQNYRSTFNKVISKEGFDGLIPRLKNANRPNAQGGAGKDGGR